MRKINKSLSSFILFAIFCFFNINAFATKIIGCSNCSSDTSFGKIYNFDEKVSNLKSDEFVVFWDGYIGTDEVFITHKGIIKNSRLIPISAFNDNELCIFGLMDFPNLDSKYPNTKSKRTFSKQIDSRYSFWKEQFNKKSINETNKICLGKRDYFLQNIFLETKYACGLSNSACKLIKFNDKNIKNVSAGAPKTKLDLNNWTDSRLCFFSVNDNKTDWTKNYQYIDYVEEAKRRGIDCGITKLEIKDTKTPRIREKYLTFKNSVTKNWCMGNKKGYTSNYQPDANPFPTTKGFFGKCPGNMKKISFEKVKQHFSFGSGNEWICSLLLDGSILNQNLTVWFELAKEINLECKEEQIPKTKIIVQEDLESKKLAEQRAQELEKERARLLLLLEEKKRLEAKARQLEKSNRLSEIEVKKRSEESAKEIAAQEREKLAKERELRRIESEARLKAEQKAKKLSQERALAESKIKELAEQNRLAESKAKKRSEELAKEIAAQEQEKLAKERELRRIESKARLKAEQKTKKLLQERALAQAKAKKLEEERNKSVQIARKLMKETELAKKKAKELTKKQENQLAAIQQERGKFIQEEKRKREELEKKLIELRAQNKKQQSQSKMIETIKLPPEWIPYRNDMSLQQKQFCQLTNRFFNDLNKAYKSKNDIKVNIVHRDRQENLDGLVPGGKINNWIFKVVKIDQVEDGSAAVVLRLQCDSYVGSGQIYTKSTWLRRSNKEWRATIPYEDRRFRELAKLDGGQFILASGTLLEVEAFKPGQIETFYASQQIGEHPLTKGLNLEGELFIADLSYIAALN
jgi:hypothetical protein